MNRSFSSRTRWRFAARPLVVAAVSGLFGIGLLGACNGDPLSVRSPSRIPADGIQSAANAQLLVNGALGDLECALGSYTVLGGLIGEELDDATQTADRFPYDARSMISSDRRYAVVSCEGLGVYTPLQTARVSANNVRQLLEGLGDQAVSNRPTLLATANLVEGYSMTMLGEGFCSTTFSTFDAAGTVVYGTELQPAQALAAAEDRFTAAITGAQAAGATAILNAALVGRARVRLGQGKLAAARADAVLVPAGFVYNATASGISGRRNNRVWAQNNLMSQPASVGPLYRALNDPRVPVTDLMRRSVTGVPLYAQTKYPAVGSPLPIASGKEAQLIVAEADAASNAANAAVIINAFRAQGRQAPYAGALDAASLKAEVIDQRRRALFLEGQHLGDLIRYRISPTPAAGTVYPAGGTYGSNVCLPLPDVERQNNPNLST